MKNTISEINSLKAKHNAVILAHNYQIEPVQLIADYLGDSLELSRIAAKLDQDVIVFAGVKFMAETAKILAPEKKVLLPRLDAGCPMADMITVEELRELKRNYPRAAVVAYVNSSVEIKAECDSCCTSANAVEVVRNLKARQVIFVPDRNLGAYVQKILPEKEMIFFEGYCYVHNRITRNEILETRKRVPGATVLVHPEARPEVVELADAVLSTSGMLRYAVGSDNSDFIVVTEQGLLERMKRENPGKRFHSAGRPKICSNMKRTSLQDILLALQLHRYEIRVEKQTADLAVKALNRMIEYSGS